jgi:hypothetical protein
MFLLFYRININTFAVMPCLTGSDCGLFCVKFIKFQ